MPRLRPDFLTQLRAAGLPEPEAEALFHPERKWRWDYCWRDRMLAVELQGAVWSRGRHVRPRGYLNDCAKMVEGQLLGWRVLWLPTDWVRDGTALAYVERALRGAVTNPGEIGP